MKFKSARYLLKIKELEPTLEAATPESSGDALILSPEEVAPRKKIFEFVSFPYKVIQIIPDGRLGNRSYEEVVNAIYSLYKDLAQRITVQQGVRVVKTQPIYFEILYDTEITFNFVVKEDDSVFLKNKLSSIFPTSTVMFREFDYIGDFEGSYTYGYNYEKHYLCSMNTSSDKAPLNSLLAIKKDIGEEEKALFSMSVVPLNRQIKSDMHDLWDNVKKGKNIISRQSIFSKIMEGFFDFIDQSLNILDEIVEIHPDVVQEKDKVQTRVKALVSELRSETKQKPNYDQFKCNFKTYVQTKDRNTAFAVAKGVETALKDMAGDNELVMDAQHAKFEAKKDKSIERQYNLLKPNNNILSTLELSSIMRLPEGSISKRFKMPTTKTKKATVPKEMKKGVIPIGQVYNEGKPETVYYPWDFKDPIKARDLTCLIKIQITQMGGGKTTAQLNFCNDVIKAKHGLICIDAIGDNKTAFALQKLHPQTELIGFLGDEPNQTISFPEVQILDTDNPYQRQEKADTVATEVKFLLNSTAKDAEEMSREMSKYLSSACKVVFIHNNMRLVDVLNVLEDEEIRTEFIEKAIDENVFSEKSREIKTLRSLDSNPSNKSLNALLSRFSIFTESTIFSKMLDAPAEMGINMKEVMDKQKPVAIVLPQSKFTNKIRKDIIVSYYMCKIRLAMSLRKDKEKICHVVLDEVHNTPNAMKILLETITEPRKFGLSYLIALHYLGQFPPEVKEGVLNAGCHFMLLKGAGKAAYDELKHIFGDDVEFEDIGNMDYQFGSINAFSISGKHHVFTSELPPALRDENGELYIK